MTIDPYSTTNAQNVDALDPEEEAKAGRYFDQVRSIGLGAKAVISLEGTIRETIDRFNRLIGLLPKDT